MNFCNIANTVNRQIMIMRIHSLEPNRTTFLQNKNTLNLRISLAIYLRIMQIKLETKGSFILILPFESTMQALPQS